jgi:hypothetical protein
MSQLPINPRSHGAAGSHHTNSNRSFRHSVVLCDLFRGHSSHLQFEQAALARLAGPQNAGDIYGCYVDSELAEKFGKRLTEALALQCPAIDI